MKICHITVAHPRYDARIFLRECVTLANAGHDVTLVCADGKADETRNNVYITSFSSTQLAKMERFKLLFNSKKFINYLLSLDANVYQFHDIELVEVGRKLKQKGKKVIFDSHENWVEIIPNYFPKNKLIQRYIKNKFIPRYYRKVVSKFDAVFSVSPNMVDYLGKFNKNSYFIPNYPSIKDYKQSLHSKSNFILYQGVVYKFSNQKEIVSAINNITIDFKYKIIGKITDEMKSELSVVDKNSKVEYINWIEKSALDVIMSQALGGIVVLDYTVICCGKEGQLGSNKIFEYMLNGLPVVCTNFKLWKELIIDKYQCGICVEPNNIEQLQEAIEWLLLNKDEADRMGIRGRDAVLKEFNWELYQTEFLQRYDDL